MIRIEISYLLAGTHEAKIAVINAAHIQTVRLCDKPNKRDIYLDEAQFRAAFMQKTPEKLSVYNITERDVGKMITVAKG